ARRKRAENSCSSAASCACSSSSERSRPRIDELNVECGGPGSGSAGEGGGATGVGGASSTAASFMLSETNSSFFRRQNSPMKPTIIAADYTDSNLTNLCHLWLGRRFRQTLPRLPEFHNARANLTLATGFRKRGDNRRVVARADKALDACKCVFKL